jgi:hypothetical protein
VSSYPSLDHGLLTSVGELEFLAELFFLGPIGVGCGGLCGKPPIHVPLDLEANDKK